jgi:hypothetical protein
MNLLDGLLECMLAKDDRHDGRGKSHYLVCVKRIIKSA